MNTSILTVILSGALLAGQSTTPSWLNDYSQAQQQGSVAKKPLAVVFGTGADGWSQVVRGGAPSAAASRLLTDSFVCVYVDTTTSAGRKLAQSFEINGDVGLVLSDRSGVYQAFWHQGDLTGQDFVRQLEKCASTQSGVVNTETINTTRSSFYPPSTSGFSNQDGTSTTRSSFYSPATFNSVFGNSMSPYSSGGYCPSCSGGGGGRRGR